MAPHGRPATKSARKYDDDGRKQPNFTATKASRPQYTDDSSSISARQRMTIQRKGTAFGAKPGAAARMSTTLAPSSARKGVWLAPGLILSDWNGAAQSGSQGQLPAVEPRSPTGSDGDVSSNEDDPDHAELSPSPETDTELSEAEIIEAPVAPNPTVPPSALVEALEKAMNPLLRLCLAKRLPFLPRNLRTGFESRCRARGIDTRQQPCNATIIYRQIRGEKWQTGMENWYCPLCTIYGTPFRNRDMLRVHLDEVHNIPILWIQKENGTWAIRITLPQTISETLIAVKPEETPATIPEPGKDPLGPAAKWEPNGILVDPNFTSCRPGGPRLYDLLSTLPTEPYGVLEWLVLEKEDEIFDSDLKDENKVMHALWARWITLHRNDFVSNFFKGTQQFVQDNFEMIHQAAGWRALRSWLLMLLTNRFLTGAQVAAVLRQYDQLIGPSLTERLQNSLTI